MFEIEIKKVFSAAHAIYLYDGSLEPIHGHDFEVTATIACDKLDEIEVVMDFHVLEAALAHILKPWQNQNLNELKPFAGQGEHRLAINPTAERIAFHIAMQLEKEVEMKTAGRAQLVKVAVTEAPGCKAIYTTR